MSISMKGKKVACEVRVIDKPPCNPTWKSEYLFALLKDAMVFELEMRKQGFLTELNRKFI